MESPYKRPWRLHDVIAAIQFMGSSPWVSKPIQDWESSLGTPRSAKSWEEVLRDHPEFFSVRIAPWISGSKVQFKHLIAKLKNSNDPIPQYLKSYFSDCTRRLLDSYEVNTDVSDKTDVSDELKTAVFKDLNSVIYKRDFSSEGPFKERHLSPEKRAELDNLELPLSDARSIRNRLLLEAEYPEIGKEDFDPRASLMWRSSYEKNYDAEKGRKLTPEEMKVESFDFLDKLSRRPLESEEIRSLVTTALEMHTHVLADERGLLDLQAEVRANKHAAREEAAQHMQLVQTLTDEMREQNKEAREARQERRWWIPLATAGLAFLGGLMAALLGVGGVIVAAILKGKSP
jgi:hypothetical protein